MIVGRIIKSYGQSSLKTLQETGHITSKCHKYISNCNNLLTFLRFSYFKVISHLDVLKPGTELIHYTEDFQLGGGVRQSNTNICSFRNQYFHTFSSSLRKPSFMSFYEEVQNFRSRVTFTEKHFVRRAADTKFTSRKNTDECFLPLGGSGGGCLAVTLSQIEPQLLDRDR